jgi:molybdenum-dependent DNA-binding transcriptional regulator ModE
MHATDVCTLVSDIGEKLLELYAEREDALSDGDMDRVDQLQIEIDDAKAEQRKLIDRDRRF